MPSKSQELESLRGLCLHLIRYKMSSAPQEIRVVYAMEEQLYATATRVALLRTAAAELVDSLEDLQGPALNALDDELAQAGLPTLSSMRAGEQKKVIAILASGALRDENEYRLLNDRLSDVSCGSLSGSQREKATQLVSDFEKRYREKGK